MLSITRQSLPLSLVCAILSVQYPHAASAAYAVTEFADLTTGNVEEQLFLDDFHLGSIIETATHELVPRARSHRFLDRDARDFACATPSAVSRRRQLSIASRFWPRRPYSCAVLRGVNASQARDDT